MNFQPLGSGISSKDRTPSKVSGLPTCFGSDLCDLQKSVKGLRYCFLKARRFLRKAMPRGNILLTLSEMSLVYGLGVCLLRTVKSTGSRGARASKPVKNLWKNGLFWLRYSFVTHSIDHKQGTEGTQEYFRSSLLSLQRFFSAGETRVCGRKQVGIVHNPPATIAETLPHCHPQEFPNLSRAFTALLTLPITTATAEKSFSELRRLKTYLRSTMKEDRLSWLALMHIHKHEV